MKLLDRYLVRTFLILFVYSMIAFLAIFLVIDVVENVDRFIDAGLNRQQILTYYALNVPFFLSTALPMSMLISSIFSIGTLAKNNELTAMKSSGISLYRITFPLLLLAIVISVVSFFFDDQITVHTNRQLEEYKDQYIRKRPPQRHLIRTNIFIQDTPDRNLIIQQFDGSENSGNQASIQYLGEDRIVKRIDAGNIFYNDSLNQWYLSEYVIREFTAQDTQSVTTGSNDTMVVNLNVNPDDILKESVDPAQMDYAELTDFIDKLNRLGIDPRKWIVN
ncbi:MAG: LptF/LptG family permease, partial [Candidatus Marinimicrobia bacterium]|nr:LptF/LptG family permease [Candidatus Neomarinimicrobiota bacterium]